MSWLKHMPTRWRLLSPKALFFERKETNLSHDVHLTPSQKFGVLPQAEYVKLTNGSVVLNLTGQHKMKHVEPDDFVIHLRSFQGGLERSQQAGKVSSAYTVIAPNESAHPAFYAWVLKSSAYIQELQTTTNQLRDGQSVRWSDFIKVDLPAPAVDEQEAIADYLDRETAQIDELITEQRALIELLRERRVAVITNLVTQGFDHAELLGDSGNSYLELAPTTWKHTRLRYVAAIDGKMVDPTDEDHNGSFLIAPNHVGSGTGRLLALVTARDQGADSNKYLVAQGQIIYSKIRPVLGKVVITPCDCLCSADMYPMSFNTEQVDVRYALYQLLSRPIHDYVTERSMRVKMPKINREELADAPWLVPPLETQVAIAAEIDQQTARIDELVADSEDLIALSLERRAALITAAVTGQIDVREAS